MTTKAEMLARVRQALGDQQAAEGALEPGPHRGDQVRIPEADLAGRFQRELQRVGGSVVFVHSPEDVREYVRRLVADKAAIVAISDGAEAREPKLREFVAGLGATVIPSLREYAAATEGTASTDSADQYKRALFEADLGITCADYAIADTGTLVISSKRPRKDDVAAAESAGIRSSGEQHRLISLVPATHLCLLEASNIVSDLKEFFSLVKGSLYSGGSPPLGMTFITGPSRTADIELTLTMGVHGPRELHVLVYETNAQRPK